MSNRRGRSELATLGQLKGLATAPANAPPHAPAVLASCAPRPGVGASERRARPFFSGGVGYADAALKALSLRAPASGCGPLRPSLRSGARAPHPVRPRASAADGRRKAANERSRAALLAEFLLHARPPRQTTSATGAVEAYVFCHFLVDVVLVALLLTEEMPLHLLVAETGPKGRASSRASAARREAAARPLTRSVPKATPEPRAPRSSAVKESALRASRFARP